MNNPVRLAFSAVLGLCIFGGAYAGTVGTTLDVNANVIAACSVTTLPVSFGDFDGVAGVAAEGSVDVTCTAGTPYNIALDGGVNYAVNTRRDMSDGGTNYLNYALFQVPDYSLMWGDSDFAATNTWPSVGDIGDGLVQPHIVYGGMPGPQDIPVGAYSDIVNVTIHY